MSFVVDIADAEGAAQTIEVDHHLDIPLIDVANAGDIKLPLVQSRLVILLDTVLPQTEHVEPDDVSADVEQLDADSIGERLVEFAGRMAITVFIRISFKGFSAL